MSACRNRCYVCAERSTRQHGRGRRRNLVAGDGRVARRRSRGRARRARPSQRAAKGAACSPWYCGARGAALSTPAGTACRKTDEVGQQGRRGRAGVHSAARASCSVRNNCRCLECSRACAPPAAAQGRRARERHRGPPALPAHLRCGLIAHFPEAARQALSAAVAPGAAAAAVLLLRQRRRAGAAPALVERGPRRRAARREGEVAPRLCHLAPRRAAGQRPAIRRARAAPGRCPALLPYGARRGPTLISCDSRCETDCASLRILESCTTCR
jgi:hypothetical protein